MIRRTLLAVVIAATAIAVPSPAVQAGGEPAKLSLPAPTGRHPIGSVALHLVDRGRPDAWVTPRRNRELMVTVWYPARKTEGHPVAPHMLPGAAVHFDTFAAKLNYGVPAGKVDWAATRTHAHEGAPADTRGGPRPVVLYSPGVADPRTWGTSLVEELVSHGYVVVTVDHTFEASEVEFPGGRVETSRLLDQDGDVLELLKKVLAVRVADTRFVLDQLSELARGGNPDAGRRRLPAGLTEVVDARRSGMFGHSGGGFTALQAMHDDARIRAAADLDGIVGFDQDDTGPGLSPLAEAGLDRPYLLMGASGNDHYTSTSWHVLWSNSRGWRQDLLLRGGKHGSFTDAQALLPQIAALTEETRCRNVGWIKPDRSIAAQRACLSGFFDHWLRGRPSTCPAKTFPEIVEVR